MYSVGSSCYKLSVEYITPRDIIVALFASIPSLLLVMVISCKVAFCVARTGKSHKIHSGSMKLELDLKWFY